MGEETITIKLLVELEKKSQKYIGSLKTHRNLRHFVNLAVNHYLDFLKKEEERKKNE